MRAKSNIGRAILSGFVATLAMTAFLYWAAPALTGGPMDVAAMLAGFLGTTWGAGMAVHIVDGTIIFPLIFAYAAARVLPGGPTARGTQWGLILWFVSQAVVMPVMGAGFFSMNAGGLMAVLAMLIAHIVYGAILGAVTGESDTARKAERAEDQRRAA